MGRRQLRVKEREGCRQAGRQAGRQTDRGRAREGSEGGAREERGGEGAREQGSKGARERGSEGDLSSGREGGRERGREREGGRESWKRRVCVCGGGGGAELEIENLKRRRKGQEEKTEHRGRGEQAGFAASAWHQSSAHYFRATRIRMVKRARIHLALGIAANTDQPESQPVEAAQVLAATPRLGLAESPRRTNRDMQKPRNRTAPLECSKNCMSCSAVKRSVKRLLFGRAYECIRRSKLYQGSSRLNLSSFPELTGGQVQSRYSSSWSLLREPNRQIARLAESGGLRDTSRPMNQ